MAKSVLFADPNSETRKRIRIAMEIAGIRLHEAPNGEDAVVQARRLRPDLVVASVDLPGLSGHDVAHLLQNDLSTKSTAVVLLAKNMQDIEHTHSPSSGQGPDILTWRGTADLVEQILGTLSADTTHPRRAQTQAAQNLPDPPSERPPGTNTQDPSTIQRRDAPVSVTDTAHESHRILENVAQKALAQLTSQICRQVVERVEQIVWEVVPEMTETMIREEIRRLKDQSTGHAPAKISEDQGETPPPQSGWASPFPESRPELAPERERAR
jgi:CheY-like chemotaxis protein